MAPQRKRTTQIATVALATTNHVYIVRLRRLPNKSRVKKWKNNGKTKHSKNNTHTEKETMPTLVPQRAYAH